MSKTPTGITIAGQPVYVEDLFARLRACLLCGDRHRYVGVFEPDDPSRLSDEAKAAPAFMGRRAVGFRRFAYGLCEGCYALPDKAALVERRLLR